MTHVDTTEKKAMLSSGLYDGIRGVAQYWLPAVGTFYAAVAAIWGLPYAVEVVGTDAALVTLLGVVMGVSKKSYDNSDAKFDGELVVDPTADLGTSHSLAFNAPLEDLSGKDQLVLKVTNPTDAGSQ